jgi:hypothetical protein
MAVIGIIGALASLVCWIIVLIKLFQEKGPLHGVLGILCGLYPFIWGWMNVNRLGIMMWMVIWSVAIVLSAVGNAAGGFAGQG